MGSIGLLPLEKAAFKVETRTSISCCDFSLFMSPNHVTCRALAAFEPVPHWSTGAVILTNTRNLQI